MIEPEQNPDAPPRRTKLLPRWPGYGIMFPAAVAIWAGWVGLGQMTGFGVIQLFPGVPYLQQIRINTSITLPIGMEAYAAFALTIWLSTGIGARLRDYARISALAAGGAGLVGQIGFHLMSAAGWQTAPWPIVTLVSCVPVVVAMVAGGLLHLIREENEVIAHRNRSPRTSAPIAPAEPPRPAAPEPTVGNPLAGRAPVRPGWTPAVGATEPARPHPTPVVIPGPQATPAPPSPPDWTPDQARPKPQPPAAESAKAEPPKPVAPKPPRPKPATRVEPDPAALETLASMTDQTMAALSIDQLRLLAKKCGQTQRGTRAQVLERLQKHRDSNGHVAVGGIK